MINIEEYIQKLLFTQESISIPGLGVFKKKTIPAKMHPGDQTFSPRKQIATFELIADEKDRRLLAEIAKSENMPDLIVENLIASYVEKLIAGIDENGKATIGQIGTLKRAVGGQLEFDPNEEFNFDPTTFGLENFQAKYRGSSATNKPLPKKKEPVPLVVKQEKEEVKIEEKPVQDSVITEKVPPPPLTSNDDIVEEKKKRKTPVGIWILVFLPIVITAVWAYFNRQMLSDFIYDRDTTPPEYLEEDIVDDQDILAIVDTIKVEQPDSIDLVALNDSIIASDSIVMVDTNQIQEQIIEPKTEIIAETDLKYYIVAGCYKSQNNADRYVMKLQDKGYSSSIQGKTPGGLHRVCYQGFASIDEAKLKLKEIHRQGNGGAWILTIK